MELNTIGLIPARQGSKRIPGKNCRLLAGKSLLQRAIESAQLATSLSEIVCSTDCPIIRAEAQQLGANVPFLRPKDLGSDDTPMSAVVEHAFVQLPEVDQILLLQPTSPLRTHLDIDHLLRLSKNHFGKNIVSICAVSKHPSWMLTMNENNLIRPLREKVATESSHHELESLYQLNGAMYLVQRDSFLATKTFVDAETIGFLMSTQMSIDIDTELDWLFAEYLLSSNYG